MLSLLEIAPDATTGTAIDFGPIILGIIAVLGLIGALKGFTRGLPRQIVRTITVVASAVLSFFVAKGIYTAIADFLSDKTMADIEQLLINYNILKPDADNSWLQNLEVDTVLLISAIPLAIVVMPLAFVLCFITVSGVMLIVHAILCAIFGFRKRGNSLPSRFLGMLLGLVQGVAVAGLLLMPIIGITNAATESVEVIKENSPEDASTAQLVDIYDDYIKSIAESPATKALESCGVNTLYKSIATVIIDEQQNDMTTLIPDIAIVSLKATSLSGIDFTHLTPENEATINELFNSVEKNPYLTRVLADGVRTFSYIYTSGSIQINVEPPISTLLNSAISIFHTSDSTNIHADVDTICDVVFILSRDGVLASFGTDSSTMLDTLTKRDENGVTTVKKVIDTINKNERTKPLIGMLTDLSFSVMSESAGIDAETIEAGKNIKASINEKTLKINKEDFDTQEEYVDAVSTSLDETLKENNITLEKDVVDNMAEYIAENYSDKTEISDDEMNNIILNYFDAYLEYMDNQEQSENPELPELPEQPEQ